MHLFYSPAVNIDSISLGEEEARHCSRVLRLGLGDTVYITDGLGTLHEGTISELHAKKCIIKIVDSKHDYHQHNFRLHLAIAPTKNIDRFEWFLEKSTEIGIDEITPLFCNHSERTHLKADRLQKVIIAAMKQSLKAYLPILNQSTSFSGFIKQPFEGQKYIAYCDYSDTVDVQHVYSKGQDCLILIGPEGDFSKEEIEDAKNEGFIPITLGKSRLRTETAGVVACTMINFINQ
jgi:16S rRNA (uracil1498-N3)-methyltransferase